MSAAAHSASATATASQLDSEVVSLSKCDLMSVLQINSALCDGEVDKGLIQAYIKWKVIMDVKEKSQQLSWNGKSWTFLCQGQCFIHISGFLIRL